MKLFIFLMLSLVLLSISLTSAIPINAEHHINFRIVDKDDTSDYVFNISTTANCNSVIYENITTLTSDGNGDISYYLTSLNLTDYSQQLRLCIYQSGILIENTSIALVPYSIYSLNVSAQGIIDDSNLNIPTHNISIGDKITLALGEIIDNLIDGWVTITGNLNVTGNASIIGNTTIAGNLNLTGTLIGNPPDNSLAMTFVGNSVGNIFAIVQKGAGRSLYFQQDGILTTADWAVNVYSGVVQNANGLLELTMDHASSNATVMLINNDGDGYGLDIDSEADERAGIRVRMKNDGIYALNLTGKIDIDGNIEMDTDSEIQLRDADINISSQDDGHLDLNADISIDLNANTTVNANLTLTSGSFYYGNASKMDIILDYLADVVITSPVTNSFLKFDGSNWLVFDLFGTANDWSSIQTFNAEVNITEQNNLTIGNTNTWWNGSCLNTEVNGTLVMSIGCLV